MSTPTVLFFGDGHHPFLFLFSDWRELQRATGCGPWEIEARLLGQRCSVDELFHAVRVGLLGGGMAAEAARDLADGYIGKRPGDLDQARLTALAAVGYALHGLEADVLGESAGAKPKAKKPRPRSPTAKSTSAASSRPPAA